MSLGLEPEKRAIALFSLIHGDILLILRNERFLSDDIFLFAGSVANYKL